MKVPIGVPVSSLNLLPLYSGSEKGVFWEKGSFQKSPFSRDSREFRDFREASEFWKIKENPTIF